MRIAYVCADHGIPVFGDKGGAVHIREMVQALTQLGHEVHLVAARVGGPTPGFPCSVTEIAQQPVDETPAGSAREQKELRNQRIADAIEEKLISLNAARPLDLIYERYSLWSAAGARAARRIGRPCILEVNAPLRLEQAKFRKLALAEEAARIERLAFSGADAIAAVSSQVADYVVANGGHPARTHVIPNGVDHARFNTGVSPMPLQNLRSGPVIGFVGSLKPWHGIDILLDAFRIVAAHRKDVQLVIAGDGPMRGFVDGFAAGAALSERVCALGWLDHAEMPALLRRLDVAVAPYPESDDFYFSPLKLFEYMATGLPVVASRIGQIDEILEGGRTGLLTTPGDPDDLARTLLALLEEPELCAAMGRAAAERSLDYTWLRNAERIVDMAAALREAA